MNNFIRRIAESLLGYFNMFKLLWRNRSLLSTHAKKPLMRRASTSSQFYHFNKTPELLQRLELATEQQSKLNAMKPFHSSLQIAIREKLLYQWTYHSNAIEGNTLSIGDTIFFLREGLTVQGKPLKDFLEAKNHASAIDYFYKVVEANVSLTPYLMKEINSLLLSGIEHTPAVDPQGNEVKKIIHADEYKRDPNHVIQSDGSVHYYVEPLQVGGEMDYLFEWVNKNIHIEHPIITSSIAHYNMVRIHPFDDGNGRGSRFLMNLILLKEGYIVAVIKIENRQQYLEALQQADNADLTPFICFVADAVIDAQNLMLEEAEKFEAHNGNSLKPGSCG